jgi:N-acetylglucosamine kinase-like BadF-type ATPase
MGDLLYLGVDVGGSKTHALICAEDGSVLGFGEGQGGNPEEVGESGLAATMRIVISRAESQLTSLPKTYQAAGFGIAGYDWGCDREMIACAIQSLELGCPEVFENDALPLLWAGSSHGWGIAVSAGTGNNVRGRNAAGKTGRISGNSIQNGEFGGASELVFLANQRLSQIWIGRGGSSLLVDRLIAYCGASDLGDLVEGLVRDRYRLTADAAPIILQAAQEGDALAVELTRFNAGELAKSVQAVAGQLGLLDKSFELVMAGSLLVKSSYYRELFVQIIQEQLPKANPRLLSGPSVVGALMMAMEVGQRLSDLHRAAVLGRLQTYFNNGH